MLVGLSGDSLVRRSGCRIGAPGAIASCTLSTGGRTSYSTSISPSASSAMCGEVAATAAIGWPLYNTLPPARTLCVARCCTTALPSRSEEHTSELQSHLHLVCPLL